MKFMSKPFTEPAKGVKAILKTSVADPEKIQVKTRHGAIPVFVYRPKGGGTNGVYYNIHGGGFVMKNARQDDSICKYLADKLNCVVINPEYDTGPSHKFPIAPDQCFDVYKWLLAEGEKLGINLSKLAIGGQSAGGCLSIGICVRAAEEGLPVPQKLIPIFTPADSMITPKSRTSPIDKPLISLPFVYMVDEAYLSKPADKSNPLVSPIRFPDLGMLPKTVIIGAEYDTLFEEEKLLAAKMKKDGVAVSFVEMKGVDHYFTHTGPPEKAKACIDLMVTELKEVM